jgi:hypothetical protein
MAGRCIQVSLPNGETFGLIVDGGEIADAAPYAKKSIGRPEREAADYYRRQGATFTDVPEKTAEPSATAIPPAGKPAREGVCPECHTAQLVSGREVCQSCAALKLIYAREREPQREAG